MADRTNLKIHERPNVEKLILQKLLKQKIIFSGRAEYRIDEQFQNLTILCNFDILSNCNI